MHFSSKNMGILSHLEVGFYLPGRFISDPLIFRVRSLMKTAVIRKRMQLHTKKCWIFLKCFSQKKNIITQKGKGDWLGESDAFWCFLAHVFYFALYSFPMISSDANEKINLAGWMEQLCKPTGSTGYGWNLLPNSASVDFLSSSRFI